MVKLSKYPFEDLMDVMDVLFTTPTYVDSKRVHITSTDSEYRMELSVPGIPKEEIKIGIKDSHIIISYDTEKTENKFFFTKPFKKEYVLPDDCDEKNITSKLDNGVLEILIPKNKKKSTERSVTIN